MENHFSTEAERVRYLLFCALTMYARRQQEQGDRMVEEAKEFAAQHGITLKHL